jgi:carbonic anhydrase
MTEFSELLERNRRWAAEIARQDPKFFERLAEQQTPKYLWIGCSDSRVPANQIIGMAPGEVFVHRNVANVVVHADLNCLSVLQFAVDILRVEHVIVCGHYGCGGVLAALENRRMGLVDNWLRHVGDVALKHHSALLELNTNEARHRRLCELNVLEQVGNVCQTTIIQDAWDRGQNVHVHGVVYGLNDGRLRELGTGIRDRVQWDEAYRAALDDVLGRTTQAPVKR